MRVRGSAMVSASFFDSSSGGAVVNSVLKCASAPRVGRCCNECKQDKNKHKPKHACNQQAVIPGAPQL